MRLIDMHSHWGTERGWRGNPAGGKKAFAALQKYFNWHDGFVTEAHMAEYFRNSNARVVLDLAFTQNLPMDEVRDQHDYSFATERAYPDVILGHWIHLDPFKPESIGELRRCINKRVGFVGMHINSTPPATDPIWEPYYRLCLEANIPVMILVGMSAIGAGVRGGLGRILDHTHPRYLDEVVAKYADLNIIAARPAWPWQAEMNAVAIHKGNIWYELHGWSPKYHPPELKYEIARRLQDKVMFAADYPMLPYERMIKDWRDQGYTEDVLEKVFHRNAEAFFDMIGLKLPAPKQA